MAKGNYHQVIRRISPEFRMFRDGVRYVTAVDCSKPGCHDRSAARHTLQEPKRILSERGCEQDLRIVEQKDIGWKRRG
ncbi:MAG TPA: hypothetical protein PKW45_20465, partial [Bryobacteraceae bacterium]|nr:hypothetical protein [Bryobacteraceae bacterium]